MYAECKSDGYNESHKAIDESGGYHGTWNESTCTRDLFSYVGHLLDDFVLMDQEPIETYKDVFHYHFVTTKIKALFVQLNRQSRHFPNHLCPQRLGRLASPTLSVLVSTKEKVPQIYQGNERIL